MEVGSEVQARVAVMPGVELQHCTWRDGQVASAGSSSALLCRSHPQACISHPQPRLRHPQPRHQPAPAAHLSLPSSLAPAAFMPRFSAAARVALYSWNRSAARKQCREWRYRRPHHHCANQHTLVTAVTHTEPLTATPPQRSSAVARSPVVPRRRAAARRGQARRLPSRAVASSSSKK